jgi:hypothetical protein
LGVVVSVDVHDARAEDEALPVHSLLRRAQVLADGGDAAARHRHATVAGGSAQAVDDARVVNDQIVHVGNASVSGLGFELRERGSA